MKFSKEDFYAGGQYKRYSIFKKKKENILIKKNENQQQFLMTISSIVSTANHFDIEDHQQHIVLNKT